MPIGKVKWYDPERGFGFVSNPGEEDVYIGRSVLPEGVDELDRGQRVEYEFISANRGPQVHRILDLGKSPRAKKAHKHNPEELNSIVADLMTMLEDVVQPALSAGRYPDHKTGRQVSEILRAVARELDA